MSRYLTNHIDYEEKKPVPRTYAEIVHNRRISRARTRLKKALRKGYLAIISVPFHLDYCTICEHYIKRLGETRSGFRVIQVKCAIGPMNCEAWVAFRKAQEGYRIEDFQ
tara:strand:+ start:171 stop:497 length:327 start_codon:yes stop_codon:yes gene_type:complete